MPKTSHMFLFHTYWATNKGCIWPNVGTSQFYPPFYPRFYPIFFTHDFGYLPEKMLPPPGPKFPTLFKIANFFIYLIAFVRKHYIPEGVKICIQRWKNKKKVAPGGGRIFSSKKEKLRVKWRVLGDVMGSAGVFLILPLFFALSLWENCQWVVFSVQIQNLLSKLIYRF